MNAQTKSCVAVCFFLFAFAFHEAAEAQIYVNVPCFGKALGQPDAETAVLFSEADYYANAQAIVNDYGFPFFHIGTDPPTTTVFPRGDGTFDATSTGFVRFVLGFPGDDFDWAGW